MSGNKAPSGTEVVFIAANNVRVSEAQWNANPGFEYQAAPGSAQQYVPHEFEIDGLGIRT